MKFYKFAILSIILITNLNIIAKAGEQLIKHNTYFLTNPSTGLRLKDSEKSAREGVDGQKFRFPGGEGNVSSFALDLNSPQIGNTDDCYPDDPDNPKGNIVISGRIISNFTNN